jgi:IS605 OrfB family transposase
MKIYTSYSVKIKSPRIRLMDTVERYREAVGYFIVLINREWSMYSLCKNSSNAVCVTEPLTVETKHNPYPKYNFTRQFYKFPSYLRRAAIAEAFGTVSSYRSNLKNWEESNPKTRGKAPSKPVAGDVCPAMYKDNCFVRTGTYTARIKVWIRNTWDWYDVVLKKSDVDYILRRCSTRKECVPTLRNRGHQWFLDFSFEENVKLQDTPIDKRRIISVDLGLINACTCSVMESDGAVVGRHFLSLPSEYDRLNRVLGRIRRAQRNGARHMPKLWGRAKGLNNDIAVKTANFIQDIAIMYNADVVVMEALNVRGKKKGGNKQRLHHWCAQYVQSMVKDKVHRLGMRFAHVCAWGTSKFAFDGSGQVIRGKGSDKTNGNYSLCEFSTGKVYNCDLNASYNIGARYFIREILGGMSVKARSEVVAKVPRLSVRSTCTLSDLYDLRAAMGYPRIPICRASNVGTAKVFPSASSGTLDREGSVRALGSTRL